ncbi:Ser/Thr protein kinase RdoA (MazF antagonist) [Nocardioides thalensis]|uniref:Ser/Thr protein kinase RdoA (MazF antagonist) n=1 Tax=Nocardioides thalensis TaxID=1914755 RepID=A0A853BXY7_9ACTN|nr:phosphotransferase [Nocardioides thalensis]NYI99625.1 Ser/Thr protein kinase RdoA (MazF antagonist) [Nocardioides thalensis]
MTELYDLGERPTLHELNRSENTTYVVGTSGVDSAAVLRVHRTGYHDAVAIASELAWLDALREEAGVSTPRALTSRTGERVVTVVAGGVERHGVVFERLPGQQPHDTDLRREDFVNLGQITARLHVHARGWRPPPWFKRFDWGWRQTLGADPRWGRWEDDPELGPAELAMLDRGVNLVRSRLAGFGATPDRWGLVHADLRLANLLVDNEQISVIDFDDCGYSWFLYDFAAAVTFLEADPRLPEWQDAWLAGYRSVAPLDESHASLLPTFLMLRRLLVLAWLGSHAHSSEAKELASVYRPATYELAERYLASSGRSIT